MADTAPVASVNAARPGWRHDVRMTTDSRRGPTDEERAFFETLLVLRRRYATRSDDDRYPVIGLHHVIAMANAAMAGVPESGMHLGIAGT
jgi:hypothetical protein